MASVGVWTIMAKGSIKRKLEISNASFEIEVAIVEYHWYLPLLDPECF